MNEQHSHYITVNAEAHIIDGWSDGVRPDKPTDGAILLTAQGGYQFRLFPDGYENPPLYNYYGIPLYKFTKGKVMWRTDDEIEAALPKPLPQPPTAEQRLAVLEAAIMEMAGEIYG